VIELCNSAAKVVIISVPTKCFGENYENPKNLFIQLIKTKSPKARK
jgi:hypothetical protein